jgi:hypothetical protein
VAESVRLYMAEKVDFKLSQKELYQPSREPGIIDVPRMLFLKVDGQGNPNQEGGEYQKAVETLYALTYTIKMSSKGSKVLPGYFEYAVPPLEGLWWLADDKDMDFFSHKERYQWISMIRQPEFVTEDVLRWAKDEVLRKKPGVQAEKAGLISFSEGFCVQAMHTGPYDTEPETLKRMDAYMLENGLISDIGAPLDNGMLRRHHEIYLGDPRKSKPESRKTVLRHPVKRRGE